MKPRIAVIYYSATGNVFELARAIVQGVEAAGGEARLARAPELAPDDAIARNPAWLAHHRATRGIREATLADFAWADGFALGTPSRFGGPAAQLRELLERTGPLWARGVLQDKAATAFTSAGNPHGGQEATLLALHTMFCHWGSVIVPPGFTHPSIAEAGGNPYGVSATSRPSTPVSPATLAAARYQGSRLATFAALLATHRAHTRAA